MTHTKCKYADKYKGNHQPKCLGGAVCDVCRDKYIAMLVMDTQKELDKR